MRRTPKIFGGLLKCGGAISLALVAILFSMSGTRAASKPIFHAKKHVVHSNKSASLRGVAYKPVSTQKHYVRHRRRVWRHRVILPKQPSRDRTEQIQEALARDGFYAGDPNGKWDAGMAESLRRFQAANGLPPTGKLDALSLQKMGLGSDVAGVSAPRSITPGNSDAAPSNSTPSKPTPKTPGL